MVLDAVVVNCAAGGDGAEDVVAAGVVIGGEADDIASGHFVKGVNERGGEERFALRGEAGGVEEEDGFGVAVFGGLGAGEGFDFGEAIDGG